MFRTVRLSIIRSLFIVHSAMIYVIQVFRQLSNRSICSCSKAVWHAPLLSVQWINSWWWTDELSETSRFSCQNKFFEISAFSWFYYKELCYDAARSSERKIYTFMLLGLCNRYIFNAKHSTDRQYVQSGYLKHPDNLSGRSKIIQKHQLQQKHIKINTGNPLIYSNFIISAN